MGTALEKNRTKPGGTRVLTNGELSAFCGQMALILGSGLSTSEGLSVMLEDASSETEDRLLHSIYDETNESGDFLAALEKTGRFPGYLLSMVRLGEETGTLDVVMKRLSAHYDREDSISRSIHTAVTYPLAMVGMMIAVILVLLVKVMPIFNRVFLQLGAEMTGVSRMLMILGAGISRYSAVLTLALGILAALLFWCSKTRTGARFAKRMIRALGIARTLRARMAACRLADGMALTLASGLSQERSMELAAALVEDPETRQKLSVCRERTEDGADLIKTLQDTGIFSGMYGRLATIGSRTGKLDEAMERIASLYQEDIDRRLSNLLAVLEPALVIGLSLIVGCILLSVMLPLLGILSGI